MKQSRMAPPLHKLDGFLKKESKRLVTLQREGELKHPTEREETKLASWGYMERSSQIPSQVDLGLMQSQLTGLESIRSLRMREKLKKKSVIESTKSPTPCRLNQRYLSIEDGEKIQLLQSEEAEIRGFNNSVIEEKGESQFEDTEVKHCEE